MAVTLAFPEDNDPLSCDRLDGECRQVAGELAPGASHPPGYGLNIAQVRRVEGKDSIRLAQLGFLDNDGFRLVVSWLGHF